MHFEGTQYETNTCPRRHLLRNPDVVAVFELRRHCDSGVGVDGAQKLTGAAIEGLSVIDEGVAFRAKTDADKAASDA